MEAERTIILKARRWGDRLALVLPQEVVAQEGIQAEDILIVRVRKRRAPGAGARRPTPP